MVSKELGYICAAIAVFCFGSNYIPVKKYQTGDGVFFQWVLCLAIWMTGLVVQLARDSPQFYPFAMLGGLFWATGNMCVVPCIKLLGLSLGMLTWGSTCMIVGWATGRFGWFGLEANTSSIKVGWLNSLGVGIVVAALCLFSQVKPSTQDEQSSDDDTSGGKPTRTGSLPLPAVADGTEYVQMGPADEADADWTSKLPQHYRVIIGFVLSIGSGFLYGINFDPPTYLMQQHPEYSQNGLDYVFAHFTGIFASSTVYFLIYCAVMKNSPKVFPQVILPGFLSGVVWAIAQTSWFVANDGLEFAIAFPIISSGPGIISSLWGIFLFNEIQGSRNMQIFGGSLLLMVGGIVCIALSGS